MREYLKVGDWVMGVNDGFPEPVVGLLHVDADFPQGQPVSFVTHFYEMRYIIVETKSGRKLNGSSIKYVMR